MAITIDGDNGVSGVNGSATTPALQGTDSNTGIVFGTDEVSIATGGSTRATVDSSGHFGIGTSPTDTGGYGRALDIQSDSGAAIYLRTNDDTSQIAQGASDLTIRTRQAHPIIFNTNNSERARLDSSGRLGIGVSDPSAGRLVVAASSDGGFGGSLVLENSNNSDTDQVGIALRPNGSSTTAIGSYGECRIIGEYDSSSTNGASNLQFHTHAGNGTVGERIRIESGGRIGLGPTNAGSTVVCSTTQSAGTSYAVLSGTHSATTPVGGTISIRIWNNGNIQNTNNSYGSLSDSKLKENIVDASSQWDDIKDIRVRNYNFIEGETHTQLGVVAQEVETVSPGLVYETPDVDDDGNDLGTVTKSVNYSVLYMKAVKALQEAQTRIETLESQHADLLARVTALEAA